MIEAKTGSSVEISWGSEARDGHCPDCNSILEEPTVEDKAEYRETKLLKRMCPQCKERKAGKLIVRQFSIEPPKIECSKVHCLIDYLGKAIFYTLLRLYEQYRTVYAFSHRNKEIPEYYRTGENIPTSMKGVLWGIFRLKTRR